MPSIDSCLRACSRLAAWMGALALGLSAQAHAQTLIADMSAGPPSGAYAFASTTPRTFADLIRNPGQGEPAQPVGHLFLPPGEGKVGAVIFVPGSGGIYSAMLDYWPKQFNAAGIALFSLDLFGPRGVKSTAEDQSQVPFAADTADAFAALKLLATHPRIDRNRIAVMGASRGGITAWRSAAQRLITAQNLPDGLRFAAHIPMYAGGCVGSFRLAVRPGVFGKAPMFWVHGDADDYTPIGPCSDYAALIGQAGTPTEFLTLEGARHKFDADGRGRIQVRGAQRTLAGCPIQLDIDTLVFSNRFTGERLSAEALENVRKSACSAVGASVESNVAARDNAAKGILAFLARVYAR
ncbi:conserved hypothetical protein [Leptothrix cholodnii SP-6]|uniref:Dienelactone hydrolase n=1 Tax=Leptothrix cholodnii (strain ATCC 51168 / LMG 8142 / SP-6) TaxID=395495 RepID=B1XWM1_LEPCP|nr:dienelactone hydrolase family protein [Leptothrix cholodnii]ACB35022.1 conserved hypothetical protein [Leptothrix cholodnii SP-6]